MASIRKRRQELEYRAYITDILVALLQSQHTEMLDIPRYIDLVEPQKAEPEQSADEIISSITDKLSKLGG